MRHGMVNRKLGRTSSHRLAMFRNQLASLLDKERIITTLPKAKELRPIIEKIITLGRTDSVHSRRQAARMLIDSAMVSKLFDTIGPRFSERPGGYTRIIKIGPRRGDNTEMAILELVGFELNQDAPEAPAPKTKGSKKDAADEATDDSAEKKPAKKAAPKKAAPKADADKPAKKAPAKKKKGDE